MGTTSTNTNVNRRQRNDDDNTTNQSQTSSLWSSKSQTSLKPTYQKIGKTSLKKIKFHSKSCEDVSKQERVFNKLDPKNPQHARKIQQRRKAIGNGKNTVGYDIYCRSISKEKRQKRSMITPSTPDHTLDIPNKKWNGMIRSWYVLYAVRLFALFYFVEWTAPASFVCCKELGLISIFFDDSYITLTTIYFL